MAKPFPLSEIHAASVVTAVIDAVHETAGEDIDGEDFERAVETLRRLATFNTSYEGGTIEAIVALLVGLRANTAHRRGNAP